MSTRRFGWAQNESEFACPLRARRLERIRVCVPLAGAQARTNQSLRAPCGRAGSNESEFACPLRARRLERIRVCVPLAGAQARNESEFACPLRARRLERIRVCVP